MNRVRDPVTAAAVAWADSRIELECVELARRRAGRDRCDELALLSLAEAKQSDRRFTGKPITDWGAL